MSEDADLYGGRIAIIFFVYIPLTHCLADLYETDFADQTELPKPQAKIESKPQESQAAKPSDAVDASSSSATYHPTSAQTPIAPLVQQIQTYDSEDYGGTASMQQGGYSEQRSVRPSEMKDDG